jgi:nucleoside recognition membrane protein YjiH
MFSSDAWTSEQDTRQEGTSDEQTIGHATLSTIELRPFLRFAAVFVVGVAFFVLPVPSNGTVTVPFDVVVSLIENAYSQYALGLAWVLVVVAGVLTTVSELHSREMVHLSETTAERLHLELWSTSSVFWVLRLIGAVVATGFLLEVGPAWLLASEIAGVAWGTLVLSIVIIIPLGSIFVNLLLECGGLEFVGTLARPVMKPLFRLPGRAALDGAASWAGSFAIGFYVTRKVFDNGGYNKREVFIICSCFGTGSIGTIGVFAAAFEMLNIFPVILLAYLVAIVAAGIITVRIPPLSRIPEEYITEPNVEANFNGTFIDYLRLAVSEGVDEARGTSSPKAAWNGLLDGLELTATIMGTVVSIGTGVLVLYNYSSVFQFISTPLEPVIAAFGIPDAGVVASALIIGFADLYVGTLTAVGLAAPAQFFVLLVVSSQILFLAAPAPMMMDMFEDIPVRFRDVVAIFVTRTLVLIPVSAALTHIVSMLGML